MKSSTLFLLIAGLLLLMISGFFISQNFLNNSPASTLTKQKIQVTASFYPLYFFANWIGGDKVQVLNITPAGAEPHDYEPTTQDIVKISTSQMLILNGSVESWGDKIKANLQGKNIKIVIAGEGLITRQLQDEAGKIGQDPHVWLSPTLAKQESEKIAQAFSEIDPQNINYYQGNESSLISRLDQLDSLYKTRLARCKQKDVITSHAAFAYLATAYGLNQVPIAGLSPDAEPSSLQLAQVVEFARARNVKYIFFESLVNPKLSETIANEIGAKTLVLDPLEGLTDDATRQGKNYFTVMEDNLQNLELALDCHQ